MIRCLLSSNIYINILIITSKHLGDNFSRFTLQETPPPHPAGIVLTRPGYYTDPSMDELAQLTDDNGHCVVENFAVGREGYGNVFFEGITDVTGLNLDDIGIY